MSRFEELAVLDNKFRVFLATTGVAFFGVGYPLSVAFDSALGFGIGAFVAALVAYYTAKRLA